jgi:hypothetical protein
VIDFATRSEYGISSSDLPALVRTPPRHARQRLSVVQAQALDVPLQLLRAALTQFPFLDITRPPPIGKLVVRSAERLSL